MKSKRQTSLMTWLPPLQTIDDIGYRALLFGFPFMTFGILTGSVLLIEKYRANVFRRSQDRIVLRHVGRISVVVVYPLEFRMARPPRCVSGDLRFRHRDLRMGGE